MRKHKGFTLVELVVVVMILGILAAVAAPKLLGTSGAASDNSLKQTLAVVRDAIERHAAEKGGKLPGDAGDQADFKADLLPYLRGTFPTCPVAGQNSDVKIDTQDQDLVVGGTESWQYNNKTGQFICNSSDETTIDGDLTYDQL